MCNTFAIPATKVHNVYQFHASHQAVSSCFHNSYNAMKKLMLIILFNISAFFSCTTKAQDSVLNTNDIVRAISTSLSSNFSFSVRTSIPMFNTLPTNVMIEYRFYRKGSGSIYINHQRECAIFQVPIDREWHHSFDKAKWL